MYNSIITLTVIITALIIIILCDNLQKNFIFFKIKNCKIIEKNLTLSSIYFIFLLLRYSLSGHTVLSYFNQTTIKYYNGNWFSSFCNVRKKISGNNLQNESTIDKCNFLVPLSELVLGKLVEKRQYEIWFCHDVRRSNISGKFARLTLRYTKL